MSFAPKLIEVDCRLHDSVRNQCDVAVAVPFGVIEHDDLFEGIFRQ